MNGDDERVEDGRLLDADVTDSGNDGDDQYGGQVDDGPGEPQVQRVRALIERCVRERGGDVKVQLIEQAHHITGPADRHGRHRKQVFEDQIPADEPGDGDRVGRLVRLCGEPARSA